MTHTDALRPRYVYRTTTSKQLPPQARNTAVVFKEEISTPSGPMASVLLLKGGASFLLPVSQIVRF